MPARLSNLVIDEVAFCRNGMNPEADMILYKARPEGAGLKKLTALTKDHEGPVSFEDAFENSRAMEIDGAIDTRLFALLDATTSIMRTDDVDREALVLAAVNEYAETMARDVPELFAGRLAKILKAYDEDDGDLAAVVKSMKTELEGAGLIGDLTKGEKMQWITKLSKAARTALDYVTGGADPIEFFKGCSEETGAVVTALVERTLKAGEFEGELVIVNADLVKARIDSGEETGIDAILKSIQDPGVRTLVEMQRKTIQKQSADVVALTKAGRRGELVLIVKGLDRLPNADDALVNLLVKVDEAGLLAELQPVLDAAQHQGQLAKQFEDLGLDTLVGEGSVGTAAEAEEALMAKAVELVTADSKLTTEQAFSKACEMNPTLYAQTRQRPGLAAVN